MSPTAFILIALLLVVGFVAYKANDVSYLVGKYKLVKLDGKPVASKAKGKITMDILDTSNGLVVEMTNPFKPMPRLVITRPWLLYFGKSSVKATVQTTDMVNPDASYIKRGPGNTLVLNINALGKDFQTTFKKVTPSA